MTNWIRNHRKGLFFSLGCCLLLLVAGLALCWDDISRLYHRGDPIDVDSVESIRQYCKRNGLSTKYCVLVDFQRPSGRDRMVIVDLQDGEVVATGPCAHGNGKGNTPEKPKFSNEFGSNCSSLGRYRMGKMRRHKKLGRIFPLQGFDRTNSNAEWRGIYVHSSRRVSKRTALNPYLPLSKASHGCFTTDGSTLNRLEEVAEQTSKPMLLVAFYNKSTLKKRQCPSVRALIAHLF